ncbi:MAG: hypothetical protein IPP35_01280 [Elusimicrobia bacterium]|nr:hypothetical protein [Elusimicrobiota bacterium]
MKRFFFERWARKSLAAGFLFIAGGVWAVPLEIGPMGGWRFGGTFKDQSGQSHTAEPSGSWGGVMDIYYTPDSAVELLFSRQESAVPSGGTAPIDFNYVLDHYQIGGLKEYGEKSVRPFLAGLLGWSHAKGKNEASDFFSMTLGGGAKYYLTQWLGVRTDLRCHLMFTNGTTAASSGPTGGSVSYSGDVFAQGEVSGAIFLAFGGPREVMAAPTPIDDYRRRGSIPAQ